MNLLTAFKLDFVRFLLWKTLLSNLFSFKIKINSLQKLKLNFAFIFFASWSAFCRLENKLSRGFETSVSREERRNGLSGILLNRSFLTARATGARVGSCEADWTANIRFWNTENINFQAQVKVLGPKGMGIKLRLK